MQTPFFFVSIAGSVVQDGVLRGVSVVTEGEAKGHGIYIDAETVKSVKACAETHSDGVQVKMDHGTGFSSIVGILKNFRIEGPKLLADLHLLKSHEDFKKIVEIAGEMPSSVGLSISFSGTQEEIDGKDYARCLELYSVDFVDRPAANPSGLFSASVDSSKKGMAEKFDAFVAGLKGLVGASENTELATKTTELAAATVKLSELTSKVSTLETNLAAKDKEITDLKSAQADFDKKVEEKATKLAVDKLAASGLPRPLENKPSGESPTAPAKNELSGIEKTRAAFRAQFEKNK